MNNQTEKYMQKLNQEEKIRLFNGEGSWKTFNANGKVPYFVMSDGPHGLRKQDAESYADLNKSKIATCFPTASCIASSWNKQKLNELGQAIAREALFENVHMVLGPGINIKRSPLCGRNFEYYSEDPYLAGTLASEYIKGMQKLGVAACVKHYAANNQETRRQTSNSIIDERTLREIYLRAFEIVVKESSPVGIMGSYNRLNREYVCASKKLLTEILRNEWGFKGIVISDWGACIDAVQCVKAGLNLAMPDSGGYFSKSLKKALAEKIISEAEIENVIQKVIETAESFQTGEISNVNYNSQHTIAKELANDSAVLLKNENFLPIPKGKIAIIGELAEFMKFQGGGSSHITTAKFPNAIEAFKNLGYEVYYSKGYYSGFCTEKQTAKKNTPLLKAAVSFTKEMVAQNIPILLFTGLTERYEGEGFDRTSLELPQEQINLVKEIEKITNNFAIINFSGAAVNFAPVQSAKAILQMYLPGQAAGESVAELVSGKVNPSGKLAETFPCKLEDVSCNENSASQNDNLPYKENVFVGYRNYESKKIPVQYEFGFGLSYSTFAYSALKVEQEGDSITATVTVTNTGKIDGREVVQIYVSPVQDEEETALRPSIELRGFEKIFLKAGESKNVTIPMDVNSFKVYSIKENKFVTIGGNYIIKAASSINADGIKTDFMIPGENLLNHVSKIEDSFYINNSIQTHSKGNFTLSDSLGDMAKESSFIRKILKVFELGVIIANKGKSKEDPSVKIVISAVKENPLESLISTSGGAISEKVASWLLKKANK